MICGYFELVHELLGVISCNFSPHILYFTFVFGKEEANLSENIARENVENVILR